MVVSTFFMLDKDGRKRFFEKSFLLADVKPDIVLGMPFLIMSNADVDVQAQDLQLRSYTTEDVITTTSQIELIGKKEFATVALDLKHEAFVLHVAALSVDLADGVHPSKRARIAYLKADEAITKVPSEYANFAEVFLPKLVKKLPEHKISNNAIK